jgi:hypothetical protein
MFLSRLGYAPGFSAKNQIEKTKDAAFQTVATVFDRLSPN